MRDMIRIVERKECQACSSIESTACFALWDDRYAFPERFQLRHCGVCGSFYTDRCISEETIGILYEQYYPSLSKDDVGWKPSRLRLFILDMLNIAPLAVGFDFKGLNVLDVGCGSGRSSSIVNRSGGKWTGLEIDPKRVEILNINGLPTLLGVPESICDEMTGSFDMVLASQVIEHTLSPRSFLTACQKLLKPGGSIVLSTPNGNSRFRKKRAEKWINWHVPYHTVIFSPQGLVHLAIVCGYSLLSIKTQTPATWFVRQKRHRRPPLGHRGQFGKPVTLANLLIAGVQCKLGDWFQKDGDMLKVVLQRK